MKFYTLIIAQILIVFSTIYSQNTWERTSGPDSTDIYSLTLTSNGDILAATDTNSTGSLFRSTNDGTTWTNIGYRQNSESVYLKITGFVVKPGGLILMTTLDHQLVGGVFISSDNGNNWSNLNFTSASTCIAMNDSGHLFVGLLTDGIIRSTNNGASWILFDQDQGLSDTHPTSFLINPSGHIFVATELGGVCRSTNDGDTWLPRNQGFTYPNINIRSLAINSNGDIFAGSYGYGVFRSTDNGDNWVAINTGITPGQGYYIHSCVINSSGDIFIGTSDGVFRSTDNGDNWIRISQGLTNLVVWSLTIDPNGYIYAGTANGVFRSIIPLPVELSSFTLKQMTDKIQLNWITKTEVNNYGFNVERKINKEDGWNAIGFVQGNGNSNSPKYYSFDDKNLSSGKYSYRLKQIDTDGQFEYSKVIEVDLISPMKYELSQNYPNPFNPVTTIQFSIPEAGDVNLTVYNILGELVAELVNGDKEAGVYTINFNAAELNSGLYIYKLTAGNFNEVKKLMVIK